MEEHLLIVTTSSQVLGVDEAASTRFIVFVASLASVLGLVAARYLTLDVTRSIARLNDRVEKIASGDLRRGPVLELEDDLGILERGIERMTIALRETVAGVAASADRVEASAGAIANAARDVSHSSAVQGESVREVAVAITEHRRHGARDPRGRRIPRAPPWRTHRRRCRISAPWGTASRRVADLLIAKVELASKAFERMFQSIARVVESTGVLSDGTLDATGGIEEMAAALESGARQRLRDLEAIRGRGDQLGAGARQGAGDHRRHRLDPR